MKLKKKPRRATLLIAMLPSAAVALLARLLLGWPLLAGWLVALNTATLIVWAVDKFQARRGGFRVPELTLHVLALIGASPASLMAMLTLRHKTQKTHFYVLYLIFLLIQAAILFQWWNTLM